MRKKSFFPVFSVMAFGLAACHAAADKPWQLEPAGAKDYRFVITGVANAHVTKGTGGDSMITGFRLRLVSSEDSTLQCRVFFDSLRRPERGGMIMNASARVMKDIMAE